MESKSIHNKFSKLGGKAAIQRVESFSNGSSIKFNVPLDEVTLLSRPVDFDSESDQIIQRNRDKLLASKQNLCFDWNTSGFWEID